MAMPEYLFLIGMLEDSEAFQSRVHNDSYVCAAYKAIKHTRDSNAAAAILMQTVIALSNERDRLINEMVKLKQASFYAADLGEPFTPLTY